MYLEHELQDTYDKIMLYTQNFRFSWRQVWRWQPSQILRRVVLLKQTNISKMRTASQMMEAVSIPLWNVGLLQPDYTALYPRSLSSSFFLFHVSHRKICCLRVYFTIYIYWSENQPWDSEVGDTDTWTNRTEPQESNAFCLAGRLML